MELSKYLIEFDLCKSRADYSMFIYQSNDALIYFMVYVDDIVVTGNSNELLDHFVSCLAQRFSVKDLGALHHFLGVEVIPTPNDLFLSQSQYIIDILKEVDMHEAKIVHTPIGSSVDLFRPKDHSDASTDATYIEG
ncbi:PREDICTED: uncharacterized protein LOC109150423 [Ipomoea nil]|uniref:uncharacterized protein LOC109150423 n=1 Tax=Ipomoea nil TaxID=35883 RepID=UPI0009019A9A|nr:PREDICTED: uncharacterized protein LOC109150423 [Ipomoea nil]